MAPLPDMPVTNVDFDVLFRALDSKDLFNEYIIIHGHGFEVDYASPGPHPKHNIKTNYVTGYGVVDYDECEDPLWPERNRLSCNVFRLPLLPSGEVAVTPLLLPEVLRGNINLVSEGPNLAMNRRQLNSMSMVFLKLGQFGLRSPYFEPGGKFQNPFKNVVPYTLLCAEVLALNCLYESVGNSVPVFPDFEDSNVDNLLLKFQSEVVNLLTGVSSASQVRPYLGMKGNRGWFHILNLELSPIMMKLNELVGVDRTEDSIYDIPMPVKLVLSDLIQAMTVAVISSDDQFTEAEIRAEES